MIGIIVWLLLIIIIAYCACPGFLPAVAVILGICALVILALWLFARLTDKSEKRRAEEVREEREKGIDKWERLHGRKHFSRMTPEERKQWLNKK